MAQTLPESYRQKDTIHTSASTYTAVNGDQIINKHIREWYWYSQLLLTLPASPAIGNEVHFIDSGNSFCI